MREWCSILSAPAHRQQTISKNKRGTVASPAAQIVLSQGVAPKLDKEQAALEIDLPPKLRGKTVDYRNLVYHCEGR
jgi:hypothetical protein